MTRVRWILAPLGVVFGCSSPPAPPPQAALTVSVDHEANFACGYSQGKQSSVPTDTAVYTNLISCDLMTGCKPDQNVVVDGAQGASVSCTVHSDGNVSLLLNAAGAGFSAVTGTTPLDPATGGTMDISESDPNSPTPLEDRACNVTITPNHGVFKGGAIWATFDCLDFEDPTAPMGTQRCEAKGAFIFENCSK
jgi:hypothetical protein